MDRKYYMDNCSNSRANTCQYALFWVDLLVQNQPDAVLLCLLRSVMTLDNFTDRSRPCVGDGSFKCLPYQLSMVGDLPTMVITGNGESGFDSGEGA